MDTANAHGAFANQAEDSAAYLHSGWQYIQHGEQTAELITRSLDKRAAKLASMEQSGADPRLIARERAQIDLFTQLRDRMVESVQRIRDILLKGSDAQEDDQRQLEEWLAAHRASVVDPRSQSLGEAVNKATTPTVDVVASSYSRGS
jgi:hypothetical protein